MSSSLSQPSSTVSGSTSAGRDIEQITCCLCPTVFWPNPLGCRKIFGNANFCPTKGVNTLILDQLITFYKTKHEMYTFKLRMYVSLNTIVRTYRITQFLTGETMMDGLYLEI